MFRMDKLKFFRRRQFALGPKHFGFEGWKRYQIADEYCLTAHPDLAVNEARNASSSITLLGYLIDPDHKERTETEVLNEMLLKTKIMDDFFTWLEKMSGRFVIIVKIADKILLFHDAVGLRQVTYCRDENGRVWCASQVETLAERLGFSLDQEVLDYKNSPMFRDGRSEFWLVNDRTPYKNILQLLPNHYLNLRSGKAIRFWPTKNCIPSLSVEEAVRLSVTILKKSIEAASTKFDLKMGISAGIDSRKTLAATKDIVNKIQYFSIEHNLNGFESIDVKVPRKLLPKLGIHHHVFERKSMSEDFCKLCEESSTFVRQRQGNIAYTLYCHFNTEFTLLNSNTSEITQCNYWLPKSKIDGEGLAIITGLYHPLAIREFDKWIQRAQGACEEASLNILGLFHWEQRGGRWASAAFGEYDIIHESFTPYNNRFLNKLLLGVSERYRRDRMWHVAFKQIKYMWPEALSEPVNPSKNLIEHIKEFIRRQFLHKFVTPWIPIYEYCKFCWKRMRVILEFK